MPIGRVYQAPTMYLNQNLQVGDLPVRTREAFVGTVRNVRLSRGFELYKFTNITYPMKDGVGRITAWWSPVQPYELDTGLQMRLQLAKRLGVHPAELTRVVAAVSEDWNFLSFILRAQLRKEVHALWGQCASQPRIDDRSRPRLVRDDQRGEAIRTGQGEALHLTTSSVPGRAWQLYIPNLTDEHIVQSAPLQRAET